MKTSLILLGVKQRLNSFKRTGEVFSKQKGSDPNSNVRQKLPDDFKAGSLNKTIKLLRNQYDGLIIDQNNKVMDLLKISSRDLTSKSHRSKNLIIFKNLMKLKSIDKKPIDKRILLILLGINFSQLKDKVLVTKSVEKLLDQDKNIERAKCLLNLSYYKNPVSLNRVTEFLLSGRHNNEITDTQKVEEAIKLINDGKKWGYKLNDQSYVILFDGISKKLSYGEASDSVCERLVNLFTKLCNEETATTPIFNALLSVLMKNFNNEQHMSWALFDKLNPKLSPNSQTFTIFLSGVNEFYKTKFNGIKEGNAGVDKSKEGKKLVYYQLSNELMGLADLIKTKLLTVEKLDNYFMTTYLDSYINYYGDWGHDYSDLGLKQLVNWYPELKELGERHPATELILDFSKNKRQTKDYELRKIINAKKQEDNELNLFLRKTDLPSMSQGDHKELELNRFILKKFVQALVQLDRPQQLMNTIWKMFGKYAGVEFTELPNISKGVYDVNVKHDLDFKKIEKPIDEKLIEYIMFHTSQVFVKEMKASTINLHLTDYIRPIFPTTEAFVRNILTTMNDEFHYFIRLNKNTLTRISKKHNTLTKPQLQYLIKNTSHLVESNHKNIQSSPELMDKFIKNMEQMLLANWVDIHELSETISINQSILDSCKRISNDSITALLKPCVEIVKKN